MKILRLFLLGLWINFVELREWIQAIFRFYYKPKFVLADLLSITMYLLNNPYTRCRKALQSFPAYTDQRYGETFLTEFSQLAKQLALNKNQHVFELGCGRGRIAFWLHEFIGCQVTAVDIVPVFIRRAQRIARWLKYDNLHFIEADILNISFETADVIYLYGTSLDDDAIRTLCEHLLDCRPGTRVITASYTLLAYFPEPNNTALGPRTDADSYSRMSTPPFVIEDKCQMTFAWGVAELTIHRRC